MDQGGKERMNRAVSPTSHYDLAAPFLGAEGDLLSLAGVMGKSEVRSQTQELRLALQKRVGLLPFAAA
jgi:hypothetical protein